MMVVCTYTRMLRWTHNSSNCYSLTNRACIASGLSRAFNFQRWVFNWGARAAQTLWMADIAECSAMVLDIEAPGAPKLLNLTLVQCMQILSAFQEVEHGPLDGFSVQQVLLCLGSLRSVGTRGLV